MSDEGADLSQGPVCPLPLSDYPRVLLGHGSGGRLSQRLIDDVFAASFANPLLDRMHDGASLEVAAGRLAFTTDSFVVSPLEFPGGDIGSLAVHGTVNDLAMCGATPLALSAGFILEEGLEMELLWRLVQSMKAAVEAVPVPIATGDTKVVERGKGDGVYINTTGVGMIAEGVRIDPRRAAPGDVVLCSGDLGVHGITIMSLREGLGFETVLKTDSAALHGLVRDVLAAAGPDAVHVLRDPTRGGVASALNEIAGAAGVGVDLDEAALPIPDPVRAACEMLGLDPLYVANEGKCLAIVAPGAAEAALEAMRRHPLGARAARIGVVTADHPKRVVLKSWIGGSRIVDVLAGEQLPRIC